MPYEVASPVSQTVLRGSSASGRLSASSPCRPSDRTLASIPASSASTHGPGAREMVSANQLRKDAPPTPMNNPT